MSPTPPSPTGPTPERIFNTLNAYQNSAALNAAIQLDFFSAIAQGHNTPDKIAAQCKVAKRGARILADFLVIQGLLAKNGGTYTLAPDAALFLDRRSPAYMGGAADFLCSPYLRAGFDAMADRVRSGAPSNADSLTPNADMWVVFARGMAGLMFMPAQGLATYILSSLPAKGPISVLDIAAGHGNFGIAFAMQNPQAKVTGQDWANVLEVAKQNAAKYGVAQRYSTLPGDILEVPLPDQAYDIVLLPNFLHHFDMPTCIALLKKISASLKPGGQVVTLEFAPNDDRVTPPGMGSFALIMLANTPGGDAWTVTELTAMYQAAGYKNIRSADLPGGMQRVITGSK